MRRPPRSSSNRNDRAEAEAAPSAAACAGGVPATPRCRTAARTAGAASVDGRTPRWRCQRLPCGSGPSQIYEGAATCRESVSSMRPHRNRPCQPPHQVVHSASHPPGGKRSAASDHCAGLVVRLSPTRPTCATSARRSATPSVWIWPAQGGVRLARMPAAARRAERVRDIPLPIRRMGRGLGRQSHDEHLFRRANRRDSADGASGPCVAPELSSHAA